MRRQGPAAEETDTAQSAAMQAIDPHVPKIQARSHPESAQLMLVLILGSKLVNSARDKKEEERACTCETGGHRAVVVIASDEHAATVGSSRSPESEPSLYKRQSGTLRCLAAQPASSASSRSSSPKVSPYLA